MKQNTSPRTFFIAGVGNHILCCHCKGYKPEDAFQNKAKSPTKKQPNCASCNNQMTVDNQAKHVSPSVYKVTIMNKNGIKFYIGATKNPPLRKANHKKDTQNPSKSGSDALRAHFNLDENSTFDFEILKSFTTMENAYAYERKLLEAAVGIDADCCNRRTY